MTRRLGVRRALVAGRWVDGDLSIDDDGRIEAVGGPVGSGRGVAAPGFVDRQVNGFGGHDVRTASPEDLVEMGRALGRHGVTAFLPTLYSSPIEHHLAALGRIGEATAISGAHPRIVGAHLEGPFLAPKWAGAHDPSTLLAPDRDVLDLLMTAGPVALVTLAPELSGAGSLITALVDGGVVVSMGHSDASAEEAHRAVDAGVSMITHCHNAHRRFEPRDPGLAGVALTRPEVTVGLICDGVHLAPETVLTVFAAAPGRVAVVTDAVAPAGTSATEWHLGDRRLRVEGSAVLTSERRLAGSAVTPSASLQWLVGIGVEPAVALTAMSTTAAAGLGIGAHDLSPGSLADLVVLDESWSVTATMVGGDVLT